MKKFRREFQFKIVETAKMSPDEKQWCTVEGTMHHFLSAGALSTSHMFLKFSLTFSKKLFRLE